MTFLLVFLGVFSIFLLVLYGLGIIRVLPKSLKNLEKKQSSLDKKSPKTPSSFVTAKLRNNFNPNDDSTLMQMLDDMLFAAGIQMSFSSFLAI